MVEEALYEAAEAGTGEAAEQVRLIYEALTSPDPNEALERYYEVAPNRFLKGFAGVSYMVMEFGDKDRAQGSIYLNGLGNLTQEIHLEILRRDKLDYLLKGLNIIALARNGIFTRSNRKLGQNVSERWMNFIAAKSVL